MSDKKEYFTAFREEDNVQIDSVRILHCVTCAIEFMWAMNTYPFFCPFCGSENIAPAGYMRRMREDEA